MPLRILLVEDEQELAGAVQTVLQRQGHVVDHCADGLHGWMLLCGALARYELAIVDWMLPGLSGPELCRRARTAGLELPLLLLTARAETADRVEGLDAGADDYLSKPFAMEELLARVRALQRRQPSYGEPVLEVGAYRFDSQSGLLEISTPTGVVAIPLARKEQQLMTYFLENPERIIPGSQLRNQLWDLHQDPVSNVVAAQIRLLRRKLAAHGLPSPIETVPSRGYRSLPCPAAWRAMRANRSPAPALLWRARLRLAALSLLVMGAILYGAGFAMARLLLQEREAALRRELQTVAGTLHDSLKPSLPSVAVPSASLAAVLPGLCLVGQACPTADALIERHAISAADPARFQLRIFDARGQLLAASPGAQGPTRPKPAWHEQRLPGDERLLSYAIHLHRAHGSGEQDWGTLQISRSLAPLDAEGRRLWWLGHGVFALAMAGMALASWWLAGLAMAPLLEAYRRQEQFSADVAHELRTPLANLLALLEAERSGLSRSTTPFQAGVLTPALPKAEAPSATGLDRMLNQGRRRQQLIADLLLLASLEHPAHRSHLQRCNLAEICADVLEDFSEAAAAVTVTLEAAINVSDATVLGVESELSRLLINLLSNALQHSPAGGMVRVGLQRRGREIQLSVQDSGPGIPTQDQGRIFERFHRLDPARSRQQGGTGLGLAIAQAIARRHGGVIRVESTPGHGATFSLRLSASGPVSLVLHRSFLPPNPASLESGAQRRCRWPGF